MAVNLGTELGYRIADAVRERERITATSNPTEIVDIQMLLARLRSDRNQHISQIADSAAQSFREQRSV